MNHLLLRFCCVAPLLAGATNGFCAPTKTAPSKAAPVAKRFMLEGTGELKFNGTMSNRGSNLLLLSYVALTKEKPEGRRERVISSVVVTKTKEATVIASLSQSERMPHGAIELGQSITFGIASKGGFYAGQLIPISPPVMGHKKPSTAFLDFTQNEFRPEEGQGKRKRFKTRYSSWLAQSGTLKIEGVSGDKVTFSVKNVVFAVPKTPLARNAAKGSFVMNGVGEARLTKIPDGFY